MISLRISNWIYDLGVEYKDPDTGEVDDRAIRELRFATKMDFGTDQNAWQRWFEENDFYTAYRGWLTPTVIRCLHVLEGKLDPDSPDYLTPGEASRQLYLRIARPFGQEVDKWKQWIAEEGIEAYEGSLRNVIGPWIRLLLSNRRRRLSGYFDLQSPEDAHKHLVEESEEDFGYDVRAWFEWFVENENQVAFKGGMKRRKAFRRTGGS